MQEHDRKALIDHLVAHIAHHGVAAYREHYRMVLVDAIQVGSRRGRLLNQMVDDIAAHHKGAPPTRLRDVFNAHALHAPMQAAQDRHIDIFEIEIELAQRLLARSDIADDLRQAVEKGKARFMASSDTAWGFQAYTRREALVMIGAAPEAPRR